MGKREVLIQEIDKILGRRIENVEVRKQNNRLLVSGYAIVFDSPALLGEKNGITYYEKIAAGALDKVDLSDLILLYNHEGHVLARVGNGSLSLTVNGYGLFFEADLSMSKAGRDLYEEIKNGLIFEMSFSFQAAEDDYDRKQNLRTVKRIKRLYDISVVSNAVYKQGRVMLSNARKHFVKLLSQEGRVDKKTDEEIERMLRRIRVEKLKRLLNE